MNVVLLGALSSLIDFAVALSIHKPLDIHPDIHEDPQTLVLMFKACKSYKEFSTCPLFGEVLAHADVTDGGHF